MAKVRWHFNQNLIKIIGYKIQMLGISKKEKKFNKSFDAQTAIKLIK